MSFCKFSSPIINFSKFEIISVGLEPRNFINLIKYDEAWFNTFNNAFRLLLCNDGLVINFYPTSSCLDESLMVAFEVANELFESETKGCLVASKHNLCSLFLIVKPYNWSLLVVPHLASHVRNFGSKESSFSSFRTGKYEPKITLSKA